MNVLPIKLENGRIIGFKSDIEDKPGVFIFAEVHRPISEPEITLVGKARVSVKQILDTRHKTPAGEINTETRPWAYYCSASEQDLLAHQIYKEKRPKYNKEKP